MVDNLTKTAKKRYQANFEGLSDFAIFDIFDSFFPRGLFQNPKRDRQFSGGQKSLLFGKTCLGEGRFG